jgi:hypothetical protein
VNPQRLSPSESIVRQAERSSREAGRVPQSPSAAERDALYRQNEEMRRNPVPLGRVDADTQVSVLGLEQGTISRLYRAGIVRLPALLACSVEDLWRSIGRHGIVDILDRLEANGLGLQPLSDYEKWRLGRVERAAIALDVSLDTRVADLWPRLGPTLTELLQKRGLLRLSDLAPGDEEGLLQLYRLGKGNLRRIEGLLGEVARGLEGEAKLHLQRSIELMGAYLRSRPNPRPGRG